MNLKIKMQKLFNPCIKMSLNNKQIIKLKETAIKNPIHISYIIAIAYKKAGKS